MIDSTPVDVPAVQLRFAKEGVERVLRHSFDCTEHSPSPGWKLSIADVKTRQSVTPDEVQRGIPFSKLDLMRFPPSILLSQDNSGIFLMSDGLPEIDPISQMAVWAEGYGPADEWRPVWEDEVFFAWLPAEAIADALTMSDVWFTITVRSDQITL